MTNNGSDSTVLFYSATDQQSPSTHTAEEDLNDSIQMRRLSAATNTTLSDLEEMEMRPHSADTDDHTLLNLGSGYDNDERTIRLTGKQNSFGHLPFPFRQIAHWYTSMTPLKRWRLLAWILMVALLLMTLAFGVVSLAHYHLLHPDQPTILGGIVGGAAVPSVGSKNDSSLSAATPQVCMTAECIKASAVLLSMVDQTVDPCQDFFRYTCQNWDRFNMIPLDSQRYTVNDQVAERVLLQLRDIFDNPSAGNAGNNSNNNNNNNNNNSVDTVSDVNIHTLYWTCMDEQHVETRAAQPILPLIAAILDKFPYKQLERHKQRQWWETDEGDFEDLDGSRAAQSSSSSVYSPEYFTKLTDALQYLHYMGIYALFRVQQLEDGELGTAQYGLRFRLMQSGLGLEMPERYKNERMVNEYRDIVWEAFHLLLTNPKSTKSNSQNSWESEHYYQLSTDVVDFEKSLASIFLSSEDARDPFKSNNPVQLHQLLQDVSVFPWRTYFEQLLHKGGIDLSRYDYNRPLPPAPTTVVSVAETNMTSSLSPSASASASASASLPSATAGGSDNNNSTASTTTTPTIVTIPSPTPELIRFQIENITIVDATPSFFTSLSALLRKTPPKTLYYYLVWSLARQQMAYLSPRFQLPYAKLEYLLGQDSQVQLIRWKRCVRFAADGMAFVAGREYMSRYFDKKSLDDAGAIVNGLKQSIHERFAEWHWMDDQTRRAAYEKETQFRVNLAYPSSLNNSALARLYQDLQVDSRDFFTNAVNLDRFRAINDMLNRQPSRQLGWPLPPFAVGTLYDSIGNSLTVGAGLLQAPFFGASSPAALNFGGLGSLLGREMIRPYDHQGRFYGVNGSTEPWWTAETEKQFRSGTQCFIDSYDQMAKQFPLSSSNGVPEAYDARITLTENMADVGGMELAYRSWERAKIAAASGEPAVTRLPGLPWTDQQLFFISYAQNWCGLVKAPPTAGTNSAGKALPPLWIEPHSPPKLRVNGAVAQSSHFADAFKCPTSRSMNPAKKCQMW